MNGKIDYEWHYPEGPGIIKSLDFPISSGTYAGTELTNHIRKSVGLPVQWKPISNVQIIAEVRDLRRTLEIQTKKLTKLESIKVKEFQNNDVYEVNKRIERLEGKIALLESNSNSSVVSVNFILVLIAINNLFLGLVWWIYG